MSTHTTTLLVILAPAMLAVPGSASADRDAQPLPGTHNPEVINPSEPPPAAALAAAGDTGQPSASDNAKTAVDRLLTRKLVLDLSVPESPAFEALGFTPERIVRPSSPRELAANLLNGVDRRGNLQTGVAIDTTPYLFAGGSKVSLGAYRDDYMTRLAMRTQFSLGTTKGTSDDDKSVRVGLGVKTTLWDAGDTRIDHEFTECLAGAHELVHASLDELLTGTPDELEELSKRLDPETRGQLRIDVVLLLNQEASEEAAKEARAPDAPRKPAIESADRRERILRTSLAEKLGTDAFGREYTERIVLFLDPEGKLERGQEITKDCFEQARRRNWNRPSWDLGGAFSWISADGQADNLASNGGALWTSLSLNLPDETWWNLKKSAAIDEKREEYLGDFVREHFQLVLHARYRPEEEVPDSSGSGTVSQDTTLVGGRLRMGTPTWALSAEAAYTYTKASGMSGDGSTFYGIGGEYRIADDLWLQVSVGSESGNNMGTDQSSVLGSFKYGFSSSSPFETWEALKAVAR